MCVADVNGRFSFPPPFTFFFLLSFLIPCFSALGAAALDGKLYICGGYDGVSSLSSVECYDPDTNKYIKKISLIYNTHYLYTTHSIYNTYYACNIYFSWLMVSHMNKHRSAAGVTVLDGQIYALGGHDGLSIFDCVGIDL